GRAAAPENRDFGQRSAVVAVLGRTRRAVAGAAQLWAALDARGALPSGMARDEGFRRSGLLRRASARKLGRPRGPRDRSGGAIPSDARRSGGVIARLSRPADRRASGNGDPPLR